jgi:hypothetical protein
MVFISFRLNKTIIENKNKAMHQKLKTSIKEPGCSDIIRSKKKCICQKVNMLYGKTNLT